VKTAVFCNVTQCSLVHLSEELASRTYWTAGARFSGRDKIFFSCSQRPQRLWDSQRSRMVEQFLHSPIHLHGIEFFLLFLQLTFLETVTLYLKFLSGPRNAVFPLGFPTKILYTFLVSCYLSIMAYPAKFNQLIRYKL
jgi:hypothetical protein